MRDCFREDCVEIIRLFTRKNSQKLLMSREGLREGAFLSEINHGRKQFTYESVFVQNDLYTRLLRRKNRERIVY